MSCWSSFAGCDFCLLICDLGKFRARYELSPHRPRMLWDAAALLSPGILWYQIFSWPVCGCSHVRMEGWRIFFSSLQVISWLCRCRSWNEKVWRWRNDWSSCEWEQTNRAIELDLFLRWNGMGWVQCKGIDFVYKKERRDRVWLGSGVRINNKQ